MLAQNDREAHQPRAVKAKAQHQAVEAVLRSRRLSKHTAGKQLHEALGKLQRHGFTDKKLDSGRWAIWECDVEAVTAAVTRFLDLWQANPDTAPSPYQYLGQAICGAHLGRSQTRAAEEKAYYEAEDRAAGVTTRAGRMRGLGEP